MGYIYLLLLKTPLAAIKMIAIKNCGTVAKGAKNSVKINLMRSVITIVISLIIWLFTRDIPSIEGWGYSTLGGISIGLSMFTWILCSESVSLCVVEVFCMLGSVVVTLLLAPILYEGETVSLLQWIGCALLIIAAILFSDNTKKSKINIKTIVLLITSLLVNAGCSISKKLYSTYVESSIEAYNLIVFVVAGAILGIIYLILSVSEKKKAVEMEKTEIPVFKNKRILLLIILASATLYSSEFFMTKATALLPSAIIYPLSYGASMTLTFLTDTFIYKEKVTLKRIIALVCAIISIVIINL